MSKKVLTLLLCLSLLMLAACSDKTQRLSVDEGEEPQSSATSGNESNLYKNPLTGVSDITKEKAYDRPVAIMINNISIAQPVQAGLNKADIIYETEVEGGITRLLAVYQDVSKVGTIGTIRSARYDYIDLAAGHNAVYVHHGQDDYHATPHFNVVDRFVADSNNSGARLSNGLASEHTLYAYGDKLWNCIKDKIDVTLNSAPPTWVTFAEDDAPVTLGNAANEVTVPFSGSYKTTLKYDPDKGTYTRYFNGTLRTDYVTKETTEVKNVFVLSTSITNYPGCTDGKGHKKIDLTSGTGYYCTNGTYTQINWKKGAASNSFEFTNTDGSELIVNQGKSWVCIADKTRSQPIFN